MFDSGASLVSAMTYREVGAAMNAPMICDDAEPMCVPSTKSFTEEQVERRIAQVRQESAGEWQRECALRLEQQKEASSATIAGVLRTFDTDRTTYFEQLESEVVRLAFAVARKILQREAEMDPDLLGALVRIALERMQTGPAVRVRVHPSEAQHWQAMATQGEGRPRWMVLEDSTLSESDCIVETEMGSANFAFDAQFSSIEQAFAHLHARRPGR